MRRVFLTLLALSLVACTRGTPGELAYDLEIDTNDAGRATELQMATERVIGRLLAFHDINDAVVTVDPTSEAGELIISNLSSPEQIEAITGILGSPFSFTFKHAEAGAVDEDGKRLWRETAIDGNDVDMVIPMENPGDGKAVLEIGLTQEGRDDFSSLLSESATGSIVGIFVRDMLVSELTLSGETLTTEVVIRDVPSIEQARVFADDVNVGVHVRFVKR